MTKQIQWFPGHMSKTLREFKEIKTDLYFLLLDARAPKSSFIDSFIEVINDKKVIVLFTKSDLVNPKELSPWIKKYSKTYEGAYSICLKDIKQVKRQILTLLNEIKFKSLLPKIVILGSPNVGKSTLLNILTGKSRAKAENRPGVTKKNNWYQFEKRFWILDTPGVLQPKFIDANQGVALASIGAIKLDILPLFEVALGLVNRLKEMQVLEIENAEEYISQKVDKSLKDPDETYKRIIRDFQEQKFGKIILDNKL